MRKQISFIHAADLHIDSPFKGLARIPEVIKQDVITSTFTALDQLVRTAIAKQVDFVLLVGDVFDHALHSLKAQVHVRQACENLQEYNIDVFMSFGNHDYLKGAPFQLTYPANVHIFQSEEVTHFPYIKDGETYAHIYGFSYENQAVTMNKAIQYEKSGNDVPFHIAMLHGSIDQNTNHEPYAPFKTADLLSKPFDYWALGHVHNRSIIHQQPAIVYPGNIQGRHRREAGEKGCYYVEMHADETRLEFIPLHSIEFKNIEMDLSSVETIEEVEGMIKTQMKHYTDAQTPMLLHITCKRVSHELMMLDKNGYTQELIEVLNSIYEGLPIWKYIYQVRMEQERTSVDSIQIEDHFLTELESIWKNLSIDSMLEPLFSHPQARSFLKQLSTVEKTEIIQTAREELMRALIEK